MTNKQTDAATQQAPQGPGAGSPAVGPEMSGEGAGAMGGTGAPQVQPGSKAGIDMSEGKGGASTGGPGGPDSGSDAMPGRSNAL